MLLWKPSEPSSGLSAKSVRVKEKAVELNYRKFPGKLIPLQHAPEQSEQINISIKTRIQVTFITQTYDNNHTLTQTRVQNVQSEGAAVPKHTHAHTHTHKELSVQTSFSL